MEICKYSPAHTAKKVPATTILDCGPVAGKVPACDKCAEAYRKNQ